MKSSSVSCFFQLEFLNSNGFYYKDGSLPLYNELVVLTLMELKVNRMILK